MPTTGKRRGGLAKQIPSHRQEKRAKTLEARQCPCVLPLDTHTKRKTVGVLSSRIIADIADNHGQSWTIADMTLTELAK